METDFAEDLLTLCHLQVANFHEAKRILELLFELILVELPQLTSRDREQCCNKFINSNAYQRDVESSRELLLHWLIDTDKLQAFHTQLIGLLISVEIHYIAPKLNQSKSAIQAIVDTVWMHRFTNHTLVTEFLGLLYNACAVAELPQHILEECFTVDFVCFLFRQIRDQDFTRETLMVLVALNDLYMLHDKRGIDNLVFSTLENSPTEYVGIGGALVWLFNRCGETEQDLKIFISKFFYLKFRSPITAELFYTNDLIVLTEVIIRELNDLPLELVDVRAMYLRVLCALLTHSTIRVCQPHLRSTLVQVLRQTIDCADNLKGDDRLLILRLAQRCLKVPWLQNAVHSSSSIRADIKDETNDVNDKNVQNNTDLFSTANYGRTLGFPQPDPNEVSDSSSSSSSSDSETSVTAKELSTVKCSAVSPRLRKQVAAKPLSPLPLPPRPPPSRRCYSTESLISTGSSVSLDAISHTRPPPPPPRGKLPFQRKNPFNETY